MSLERARGVAQLQRRRTAHWLARPFQRGVASGRSGVAAVPSEFFHNALHELRTIELENVRKGAQHVVSVGASGRWYFDWFERHYGPVARHVGIEAFEPEPVDLPAYASWIPSTADRFDGIEDASVDLVFAGQTTEHLWEHELLGFLLEAARVVPTGGLLVVDSPNRLVTEHLDWSHGGHTIELSSGEWSELVALAGFDVVRCRGAWWCDVDGRIRQLEEGMDDPSLVVRRIVEGGDRPDGSFIWWVDARRAPRPPEPEALRRRIGELFTAHWDVRVSRGMWPGPGAAGPLWSPEDVAPCVQSLPVMLHAGTWRLTARAAEGRLDHLSELEFALVGPDGTVLQRPDGGRGGDGSYTWEFDLAELVLAVGLRLSAGRAAAPVRLAMPIRLEAVR